MGLACKIHRNRLGDIDFVEAPNGQLSELYQQAVEYTNDREKSLDIWTVAYTNGFNENGIKSRDKNGEPLLKDVLSYIKLNRVNGKRLQKEHIVGLQNNLLTLEVNSLQDLYVELRKTFYENGVIKFDKVKLEKSWIYTTDEINEILSNKGLRKQIVDIIDRIEGELMFNEKNTDRINSLIETHDYYDTDVLVDYGSYVGIGKAKVLNPNDTHKDLSKVLAGIKSKDEFDKAVSKLPYDAIIEKYNKDKKFANDLFEVYSNIKPVYKVDEQGNRVKEQDRLKTLKDTVVVYGDASKLNAYYDILNETPNAVWEESEVEITNILKDLEKEFINYNIDIVGLSETFNTKSQKEILDFVDKVITFVEKVDSLKVSDSEFQDIVKEVSDFLGQTENYSMVYDTVSLENSENLIIDLIDDYRKYDELDLFNKFGYIKTSDGSYFHKVNKLEDTDSLLNLLYNMVLNNHRILPQEAYYPTAFTEDNKFSLGELKNHDNVEDIKNDISKFLDKKVTELGFDKQQGAKELLMYKYILGHPIKIEKGATEIDFLKQANFNGNEGYLTDDFISDFYNYVLEQKANDTELYRDVLSKFTVQDDRIILNNPDMVTVKKAEALIKPSVLKNLKQYALISDNNSLKDFVEINNRDYTLLDKAEVYKRNSLLLENYKGDYTTIDKGKGLLKIDNVADNFIRINNKVYVKTDNNIYQEVGKKYSQVKEQGTTLNKGIRIKANNLYSENELKTINKELDECI